MIKDIDEQLIYEAKSATCSILNLVFIVENSFNKPYVQILLLGKVNVLTDNRKICRMFRFQFQIPLIVLKKTLLSMRQAVLSNDMWHNS